VVLNPKPFSLRNRFESFKYAMNGIKIMLRSQHNAWLHALATIMVALAGIFFGLERSEWCWIILAVMAVWTAEALNTAFEFLADVASPEYHPLVKKAKDVAAGAVLISAIGSVLISIFIILPRMIKMIEELFHAA